MSMWSERYSAMVKATRNGVLPKASERQCESCGGQAKHRHHDDYTKPLEVIFLCTECHWARHTRLGWGRPGRPLSRVVKVPFQRPEPGYASLLTIPPFDFAYLDKEKISHVSQMANLAAKRTDARFKCFSADEGVVVFRLQ